MTENPIPDNELSVKEVRMVLQIHELLKPLTARERIRAIELASQMLKEDCPMFRGDYS